MTSSKQPRFRDTTSIAGWLFADLFLGLIIVFMASSQVQADVLPTSTPTATPTLVIASSTPEHFSPFPTQTPQPTPAIGLDLTPLRVAVQVDDVSRFLEDDPAATRKFFIQFGQKLPTEYENRTAGLVIALGYHNSGNIQLARRLAIHGIDLLQIQYPKVFSSIVEKTYWWDNDEYHPVGTIEFEIYFYTE